MDKGTETGSMVQSGARASGQRTPTRDEKKYQADVDGMP